MTSITKTEQAFSVFEYLYRDASNYKAHGQLLLAGSFETNDIDTILNACEFGQSFVAEQVGVPTLYHELYTFGGGPTENDQAFHEFDRFRKALPIDSKQPVWGTVDELIIRFAKSRGSWDCKLSPHA